MSSFVAVLDTRALFPQTLRDVLLRAAEAELYRLRWSEEILDELRRNLQEELGLTDDLVGHLLTQMRMAFADAAVTGYERLVGSMTTFEVGPPDARMEWLQRVRAHPGRNRTRFHFG